MVQQRSNGKHCVKSLFFHAGVVCFFLSATLVSGVMSTEEVGDSTTIVSTNANANTPNAMIHRADGLRGYGKMNPGHRTLDDTAVEGLDNLFAHQDLQVRVVGGEDAKSSRFPYFVVLTGSSHFCGGSLVAPDIVLTAAHCSVTTSAFVGLQNLQEFMNADEIFRVQSQITHPSYDAETFQYDQKLLKLEGSSSATPLAIDPPTTYSEADMDRMDLQLLGFGVTETGSNSNQLQQAKQSVVPKDRCLRIKDGSYRYKDHVTSDMICASARKVGPCYGDSGGPLVSMGQTARHDSMIGIVSWGRTPCADWPAIYSSVNATYSWIKETVCELSENPPRHFGCPTSAPSMAPLPTPLPTIPLTDSPTTSPTTSPTALPTPSPTNSPTTVPTTSPTTPAPTKRPTNAPIPTMMPTVPTSQGGASGTLFIDYQQRMSGGTEGFRSGRPRLPILTVMLVVAWCYFQ